VGFIKEVLEKEISKKILVLATLGIILYAVRGLINVLLLTFLFTYLMYSIHRLITSKTEKYFHINNVVLTIVLYAIFAVLITSFIYKYIPVVIDQIVIIINQISTFDLNSNSHIMTYLMPMIDQVDISAYTKNSVNYLFKLAANVGKGGINVFMALILSLFFMLEKEKLVDFSKKFRDSRIAVFYNYVEYFARSFTNSFGKVIQAQILIALTNTTLSVIVLWIMHFPQLLGLGLMVFVLSLIPVAGVIISLIPLCIIAFNMGGIIKVAYVVIMVAVLHGLESYVLNPKFMADKTELPVFLIFLILIVSEYLMGTWGLLIGIPMFIFILDLLNVKVSDKTKPEKVK
jgi:predicted PurR-regulated permease PerM